MSPTIKSLFLLSLSLFFSLLFLINPQHQYHRPTVTAPYNSIRYQSLATLYTETPPNMSDYDYKEAHPSKKSTPKSIPRPSDVGEQKVPVPLGIAEWAREDIDKMWEESGRKFCGALCVTEDPGQLGYLDEYIQDTVAKEWFDGKYGPTKDDIPELLIPQINKTVERIMQEYVDTEVVDDEEPGSVAQIKAAHEYLKGYRALYVRLWLQAHQEKAFEDLEEHMEGHLRFDE